MKYKGIFFDIGWTLMQPTRSWFLSDLFYKMAPSENLNDVRIAEAMEKAMPILDENHRMDTTEEEERQFYLFYQHLLNQLPELQLGNRAARLLAYDKVYNYKNYTFFPDVLPVLTQLKQHYRLGIISDTWPSAVGFLKDAGIYELFDHFTFSYQLGVFKPDPQMYQHAINGLGLPAQETLFVDDCLECLQGAATAGITPIQMLKKPGAESSPDIMAVNSMTELLSLLSKR